MNDRVRHAPAAEVANRDRSQGVTKSLPKRGQIKSKIVASAFHCITNVICQASSAGGLHFPRQK
ncbi:hypothetical protein JHK82_020191 [Glycine max]|nr:hypothetical protein JHK87_020082 [Glycine soja]KAG5014508.1 hypothetical protein JHK85_020644 [Glycine max]KAG5024291.1 hypothetical protein JHK86_020205 [Glycine max]KAG5135460.1 hypothetical protein JHK82_020191 [Glycine max]KHN16797.1 hypothetical protein glysoja_002894 [Glycine soja]